MRERGGGAAPDTAPPQSSRPRTPPLRRSGGTAHGANRASAASRSGRSRATSGATASPSSGRCGALSDNTPPQGRSAPHGRLGRTSRSNPCPRRAFGRTTPAAPQQRRPVDREAPRGDQRLAVALLHLLVVGEREQVLD